MSANGNHRAGPRRLRRRVAAAVLGVALVGSLVVAATAEAAKTGFPRSFNTETGLNTYSTNDVLNPQCPNALAATPGSFPASKILNSALNTPTSFAPSGTVHFIYEDNPHTNSGTQNFTIQDCVFTYPAGFFPPNAFDPVTGLPNPGVDFSKSDLVGGGTQIDGASLSGIVSSVGKIYYSWTAPATLSLNSFVCFFARDIRNDHGGTGNRKVPPTCYLVRNPPPPGPQFDTPPEVRVAYADDYHMPGSVTQYFPTPWRNGTDVVHFLGCFGEGTERCGDGIAPGTTADGKYDGGAVQVKNVDPAPLKLLEASVDIGPCHFEPWNELVGPGLVVNQGGIFILTQTGLRSAAQMPAICGAPIAPVYLHQTNFDTSERPGDTDGVPNCSTTGTAIPRINLTFADGPATVTVRFDDTLQILNTGGMDAASCNPRRNEAAPWSALPLPQAP